jgi:hypothetical protein
MLVFTLFRFEEEKVPLESAGKSTVIGESLATSPKEEILLTKKRLFSEVEEFIPPNADRFNSMI